MTKKQSKKQVIANSKIDENKFYSLEEAISLALEIKPEKFDSTLDLQIITACNPKKPEQMVRGTVALPNGTGKDVKVVAFCTEDKIKECKEAGAIFAGSELVEKIKEGFLDFDVAIASPDVMKDIAKFAKTLGPKGLMPSPKAGTISDNLSKTIKELKAGRIEFKSDSKAHIHCPTGKTSFGSKKLIENVKAILNKIIEARPNGVKEYIKKITISTSMGPGIKVSLDITKK